MLCNICKKNPATIHIQEISGSEKKTLHLCQSCAEKKAQEDSTFQAFNLAEVLYNISNNLSVSGDAGEPKTPDVSDPRFAGVFCPTCSWDYDHFRKTGRLGCPACYQAFAEHLKGAISAMHRGTTHPGKVPPSFQESHTARQSVNRNILLAELEKLRETLKTAIAGEEYENAAVLRDRMSEIKKQIEVLDHGTDA